MLTVKDMEDLIYIHDACDTLNTTLMGTRNSYLLQRGAFRGI